MNPLINERVRVALGRYAVDLTLLVAVWVMPMSHATAQQLYCSTAQTDCPILRMQQPGSPCRCSDNPRLLGEVVINDGRSDLFDHERNRPRRPVLAKPDNSRFMGEVIINDNASGYPDHDRGRGRRRPLRNDDLEDADDVLSGPRYHRRGEPWRGRED